MCQLDCSTCRQGTWLCRACSPHSHRLMGIPWIPRHSASSIYPLAFWFVSVASANLVFNGGFELPVVPAGTFVEYHAGDEFSGWRVVAGSIDLCNMYSNGEPEEGLQSVDMNGSEAGTIEQDIATTTGWMYNISYWVSMDFAVSTTCDITMPKTLFTYWGGVLVDTTVVSPDPLRTSSNPEYIGRATSVVGGTGSSTVLGFQGCGGTCGYCGPQLDDVIIEVIPSSTPSSTPTSTPHSTSTPSLTPTPTPTSTASFTASVTKRASGTASGTPSPSRTASASPLTRTPSISVSPQCTVTNTPSASMSAYSSPSTSPSTSNTPTPSETWSSTRTAMSTQSGSSTSSPSWSLASSRSSTRSLTRTTLVTFSVASAESPLRSLSISPLSSMSPVSSSSDSHASTPTHSASSMGTATANSSCVSLPHCVDGTSNLLSDDVVMLTAANATIGCPCGSAISSVNVTTAMGAGGCSNESLVLTPMLEWLDNASLVRVSNCVGSDVCDVSNLTTVNAWKTFNGTVVLVSVRCPAEVVGAIGGASGLAVIAGSAGGSALGVLFLCCLCCCVALLRKPTKMSPVKSTVTSSSVVRVRQFSHRNLRSVFGSSFATPPGANTGHGSTESMASTVNTSVLTTLAAEATSAIPDALLGEMEARAIPATSMRKKPPPVRRRLASPTSAAPTAVAFTTQGALGFAVVNPLVHASSTPQVVSSSATASSKSQSRVVWHNSWRAPPQPPTKTSVEMPGSENLEYRYYGGFRVALKRATSSGPSGHPTRSS